jgi:tripartite-type tricarboxylate transporter receptor subunit TctC
VAVIFDGVRNRFVRGALALLAVTGSVHAQTDYPTKPIQIVTSFPAGMATDIVARVIADKLSQRIGQQVYVTNKPGGGGIIATESVAKAAPDGYTLLVANPALATNAFLYKKLPYNTTRDFVGVALLGESPYLIVVNPELGARTIQEFIAIAKKNPRAINYVSGGMGGATHLACELFATKAGIEMTHVPYINMSNLTPDLWANRVQVACFPTPSAVPLTKDGKMLALGASTATAVKEPIAVPSVKEATGIDYIASNWNGLFAPSRTPRPILEKLAKAMEQVLADPEVKTKLASLGMTPNPIFLGDFDKYFQAELQRWEPVIKLTGVSLD